MSGQNIGDVLNKAGITWGSFMGGFADCTKVSTGITGLSTADYIPHHAFFQYWTSTANPNHVKRTSVHMIGHQGDAANHNYDLIDFWDALAVHNLPAVSIIKARAIEDGHAGYSDPLDEQNFLVQFINKLERTPEWNSTAVVIMYDDSDGWYDHVMGPIVNQSNVSDDELLGPGNCGTPKPNENGAIQNGRCGYGPRLPLLVVSPFARSNFVDHRVTDQSSVIRFVEDNWKLDRVGNGSADAIAGTLDGHVRLQRAWRQSKGVPRSSDRPADRLSSSHRPMNRRKSGACSTTTKGAPGLDVETWESTNSPVRFCDKPPASYAASLILRRKQPQTDSPHPSLFVAARGHRLRPPFEIDRRQVRVNQPAVQAGQRCTLHPLPPPHGRFHFFANMLAGGLLRSRRGRIYLADLAVQFQRRFRRIIKAGVPATGPCRWVGAWFLCPAADFSSPFITAASSFSCFSRESFNSAEALLVSFSICSCAECASRSALALRDTRSERFDSSLNIASRSLAGAFTRGSILTVSGAVSALPLAVSRTV